MLDGPITWAGRILRKAGTELLKRNSLRGIWIDVGAHHGENTLGYANHNPGLTIYAFEPNLRAAATLVGKAPNFIPIPIAVAEADGTADFDISCFDCASSLLKMNDEARRSWTGGEDLRIASSVTVPTIRLDTFMNILGIVKVDFLKVDAQGADLSVLRSAGSRLFDITKITLEVDISPVRLYDGSASRDDILAFLGGAGFKLVSSESQSSGQEENLTFERSN